MKKGLWATCILMAVGLIQIGFGPTAAQAVENAKKAEVLFVQNAKDVTVDDGKLILFTLFSLGVTLHILSKSISIF